jgi:putative ABC transport system ATP-binding protein/lipoprotein-releasing system ATP-binding protein
VSDTVLSARDLRKTYQSGDGRLEVLAGVNLDVMAGESVSIRGESGSGKSTLLNLLSGLDQPDSGRILWDGSPDTGAGRRAAFLGMVFQSYYLVPELNALENVLLAGRIRGTAVKEAGERAAELLNRVGLSARAKHLPAQLSGGERQRVAVARALMNSPRLVLADEPTGNLDERIGTAVIELICGLCAETKTALVLVTHNAAHAERASRHLTMTSGTLA